jgi:hypothetical protein
VEVLLRRVLDCSDRRREEGPAVGVVVGDKVARFDVGGDIDPAVILDVDVVGRVRSWWADI